VFRQRLTTSTSSEREAPCKGRRFKEKAYCKREKLAHSRQHLQSQNYRRQ
jgi:hypothetical protein